MPAVFPVAAVARLLGVPCHGLKLLGLVAEDAAAEEGLCAGGPFVGLGLSPRTSGAPGRGAAGAPNWISRKALAW